MKRKINLMYLVYSLEIGGVECLVANLAKTLDREKFNVSICILKPGGVLEKELAEANVPIFEVSKKEGIDFFLIFRLIELFEKLKIDIIHSHNPVPWIYGGLAAMFSNVKRIVHTEHSSLYQSEKKLMFAEFIVSQLTHTIICDSREVAKHLSDKQYIKEKKIKIIFNGVDVNRFQIREDAFDVRKKYRIMHEGLILGIVARLEPVKNHMGILAAFGDVLKVRQDINLVIVGDGSLRQKLVNRVSEMGISDRVYFLGAQRNVEEIINIFDIFILNSLSEGLPLTLLEAMSCKKPVVATDVGGNSEVVINNENGFLVASQNIDELRDRLLTLIENKDLRETMGRNGFQRIFKLFSFDVMKSEYEKVYLS